MTTNIVSLGDFKNLSLKIDEIARIREISYIDAVILYAEENEIDIEFLGTFIAKNSFLKEKIEHDARALNFLKKDSTDLHN